MEVAFKADRLSGVELLAGEYATDGARQTIGVDETPAESVEYVTSERLIELLEIPQLDLPPSLAVNPFDQFDGWFVRVHERISRNHGPFCSLMLRPAKLPCAGHIGSQSSARVVAYISEGRALK